ncbi:MAG TPA: tetratricopeptide repeat protein [Candidatus Dormibacteraeota bacterium]|nr:tetratricopeptide repeat protein [Candidatus Dormibacteraeota bacterium]
MKMGWRFTGIGALGVALAASLAIPAVCRAQGTDPNNVVDKEQQQQTNQDMEERTLSNQSNQSGQSSQPGQKGAPAPKIDPKENAAYKAFFDTNPQDADTRIQLGEAFVKQYPSGPYTEAVYAGLVQAYYLKQDWKKFYDSADKALAINPNDVDVLVTVGWVIPHVYNANDPGASKQLDKAEEYEKRALQGLAALPKPADMTDQQFTAAKADKVAEAHSGLGLVYFRRQNFAEAAKELEQATQGSSHPDPTDYYALGAALQNTQQYGQAADAFDHCAQIPGSLQAQCKQSADAAKKLAAQGK